nr:MAG TPA: Rifin [Caudoviricetes sp.]
MQDTIVYSLMAIFTTVMMFIILYLKEKDK